MKTVFVTRFGDTDGLELRETRLPTIGRGEVHVDVVAASINPIDGKIRRGEVRFISGTKFPMRLGGDLAGVVRGIGPGVEGLRLGDAVLGLMPSMGGAYAESVVTRADRLVLKPPQVSFAAAAAAPVAAGAALAAVRDVARVGAGMRVLVNGCAGGIGTFAIQMAKARGAHVTGTCRDASFALARSLGCDATLDYRDRDALAREKPFDVVLELSGRWPFAEARSVLGPRGVLVNPTPTPTVIVGSKVANLFRRQQHRVLLSSIPHGDLAQIAEDLGSGALQSCIDRVFPFASYREAIAYAERGGVAGKVVLEMVPGAASERLAAPSLAP